ncbi:MAG: Mut7-C RNAse domain-containing protein [Thermoplasmatota archaeon]
MDSKGLICDEMLKKLTRWLRIAGYDVLSPSAKDDRELARLAMDTDRILITRDKDLSNMRGPITLKIISDDIDEQLEEIGSNLASSINRSFSRCPLCNGRLVPVQRNDLPDRCSKKIPPKVLHHFRRFYICTECGKIYWRGSHWNNILKRLKDHGFEPILPGRP